MDNHYHHTAPSRLAPWPKPRPFFDAIAWKAAIEQTEKKGADGDKSTFVSSGPATPKGALFAKR